MDAGYEFSACSIVKSADVSALWITGRCFNGLPTIVGSVFDIFEHCIVLLIGSDGLIFIGPDFIVVVLDHSCPHNCVGPILHQTVEYGTPNSLAGPVLGGHG
jgi:hypothetical protein